MVSRANITGPNELNIGATPRFPVTILFVIGGLGLFAILVWRIGPELIGNILLTIGWSAPLVFLPHVLVTIFEASGWLFAFSENGRPLGYCEIFKLSVAAKAIQHVTPSLSQAGELVKIYLLRTAGVSSDQATASVVASKVTITLAELLFIGVGLVVAVNSTAVVPPLFALAVAGILGAVLLLACVLLWQRTGLFRPFVSLGRRFRILTTFLDKHDNFLRSTDMLLSAYVGEHRRLFGLSCFSYFLGWLAGAVEVWVFLRILGIPADPTSALVIQGWLVVVNRLTSFVPGNLGTHEAGAVMIFSFLGLAPEGAMAFALLRRVRQIGWIAAGLGVLAKVPRAQHSRFVG